MKTETKQLLKAVSKAATVVETNSTMPIIQNILFSNEGGKLTLSATDLQSTIKVSTELDAPEGLSVAVPTKTISDLLKTLSGDITLTFDNNVLLVKASTGEYKIATYPGADFPAVEITEGENKVKGYLIEKAIEATSGSVSSDDLRPAMSGIYFDLENGNVAATNGHRMSVYGINLDGETSFIVPPKNLTLLKGLQDQDVKYAVEQNHVHFKTDEFAFKIRLVDAKYPPYLQVIPKGNDKELAISQEELLGALKRVSLFTNSDTKQVKLTLGDKILISGEDLNFNSSAEEDVAGQYSGDPLTIGFNAKYVIDLLNTTGEGRITLTFSEPNKPALMYNTSNPKLTQLVMPVMI